MYAVDALRRMEWHVGCLHEGWQGSRRRSRRLVEPGKSPGRCWRIRPGGVNQSPPRKRQNTMNSVTRWNPFTEMDELQRRLASVFGLAPYRRSSLATDEENMTVPEWAPAVDIIEDEKEYLIKVEVPEVQKDQFKVTVEGNTLTLSGERKGETEEKNRKLHRIERYYGRFLRSFTIPEDAEGGKVNAELKDGVLWVHLAKSEKARPKQIEVKVV